MSLPALTIIPAGAGSGKTYTIQTRLAEWVRQRKVAPEKIVAVTFTEAAASELRERIRTELVTQGRLEDALGLDQSYISTIHSFGLRILTEFALDAGFNPLPRLLTEDEQGVLVRLALAATDKAEGIMGDLYRYGYQWDFTSGKGEEEKFRDRVLEVIRRLRTLGPGVDEMPLAHWAAELIGKHYGPVKDPEQLTEALQRAIASLLEQFPQDVGGLAKTKGVARSLRDDHKYLRRAGQDGALKDRWFLWNRLRNLQTSTARNTLPEDYERLACDVMSAADGLLAHPGPLDESVIHMRALFGAAQDSLSRFAQGKAERGLVDYTDMLALAFTILDEQPEVLTALKARVDCLVIDEFQDTNPLQFALLWSLYRAGVPTLIVGDLKQAIMGFQDADSRLLEELQDQNSEAVAPLVSNWRSHPGLMAWVNGLGTGLFGSSYTALEPKADFPSQLGALDVMEFRARSNNGYRAEHTVARIKALLDDPATCVWDKALKKTRPIRGGDVAIICPTNTRLEVYAKALRRLGIRARIGADGWFQSRIVQLAYYALCYVADPLDRHAALYLSVTELGTESLQSAIELMLEGKEPESSLLDALRPLRAGCHEGLPASLLPGVIDALDLYGRVAVWPDSEQARANLLRLENEAAEFVASNRDALAASGYHGTDLKTFLCWIKARAERENAQPDPRVLDEDAVQLMTWHRSKGREWPVVAVCGTDSDIKCLLPNFKINYEDFSELDHILEKARLDFYPEFAAPEKNEVFRAQLWPEDVDSARRLLYVALTRAREKIILEWPGFLDNGKERKDFTYWEQLIADTGMALSGHQLTLGGQAFDCRVTQLDKDRDPLFEGEDLDQMPDLPVLGRRALQVRAMPEGLTPDAVQPSALEVEVAVDSTTLIEESYASALSTSFDLTASERGTLLHRCFEVIDGHRSRDVVCRAAEYPLTEEQFTALQAHVGGFNDWLSRRFTPVHCQHEQSVLVLNEQASVVSGFIDLLVETEQGYWIIDHKSDQVEERSVRFLEHLPQLLCYVEALRRIDPEKPVLGVGINWVSYGQVALMALP
ncbi:MAG: hypothetical protein C0618_04305 [Desulfuromonas sp.]|nr:MAG: hypothetical protein C0618_04305 [Desulfuromonas sp.]